MAPSKRSRFRKAFAKHKDQIKAAVTGEEEIFQRLGRWLGIMDAWYEQMPVLMDLCLLRDALAQHIVPLAAWGLRPHLRPILGRVMPPPDPPDAVLKDVDVLKDLGHMKSFESTPLPEVHGYPKAPCETEDAPEAPILMGRLRESRESTVEQKPPVVEIGLDDREGSDSGTLDYSTDEEDGELHSPREIGFHRILAPVLT